MPKTTSPAPTPDLESCVDPAVDAATKPTDAEAGASDQPKRTRRGRPGYDRETLINKATEVFVSRGYDGTSMDTVARELGITKSAIYHHVKSKEELLHLAINRGIRALDSAVEAESQRTGSDALTRLRSAVHASVVILIEYHHSVTLLLRVRGNSDIERRALEARRRIDDKIRVLVAAAIEEGGLRSDFTPGLITRLLFGMVNSITEWYRPSYPAAPEKIADAVTSMAFNGLEA
ncbi:transcriptional regulator, TetR family [Brevibacterium sp. 239c]|uniref:TetR/AcrR family transcriptional regulator n=1 Tax=Brevibacterium sp. 239c TaxID=1965356 RepID=UPI000C377B3C|nr:TetR/AcrR family transcriptional regulator [Brevibacterium sp. 239c]SMX71387.1 transcriptional regulator, TetR family [Brevibacterium sp. 239c]